MKKLHYFLIFLTLAFTGPSTLARTGGSFLVSSTGTSWAGQSGTVPVSGDMIKTGGTSGFGGGNGFYVYDGGIYTSANGWHIETANNDNNAVYVTDTNSRAIITSSTLETHGTFSQGLAVTQSGSLEGRTMDVTTHGTEAYGGGASFMGRLTVVSSTFHTIGSRAHGVAAFNSGTITVTGSEFVLEQASSSLVNSSGTGTNTFTLTQVTADLAGGSGLVLNNTTPNNMAVPNSATTILTINQSSLSGNILTSSSTQNTVNLSSNSTLTGMSTRSGVSTLSVNIDSTSEWDVTAASTLTNLNVRGTLGVTLTGTGYTAALVTVGTTLTIDSFTTEIMPIFDASFIYGEDIQYSYQIFNTMAVSGRDFLPFVDWSNLEDGWTVITPSFTNGVLKWGLEYTIPEPGTWVLMLGGFSVLSYLQRRRHRK